VTGAHVMLLDPLPVIESRQLHATVTLDNPMAAEAELLSVSLALLYRDSSGDISLSPPPPPSLLPSLARVRARVLSLSVGMRVCVCVCV
jgi:hypothetical protein